MILDRLDIEMLGRNTENADLFFWGIEKGYHYIATRHFAFRVSVEDMEEYEEDAWELKEFLIDRFKESPVAGQTLVYRWEKITSDKHLAKQLSEGVFTTFPTTEGIVTPYIYACDAWRYRFTMFGEFNLFSNDDFISVISGATDEKVFAESEISPLYLLDNNFVILPIAPRNSKTALDDFAKLVKGS